jgi:hypothetical protein
MKLLANPLSQQAGKWLVIRRRPESSGFIEYAVMPVRCTVCLIDWIPAFAGMTA